MVRIVNLADARLAVPEFLANLKANA